MEVKHNFALFLAYLKINLSTAMEYRINFIVQSIFMILNDLMWIIFWSFFFNHFKNINGWGLNDVLLLFGLDAILFAIASIFFGNFRYLHEVIANGNLDFYLTLPKSELFHILISKSSFSAWGDLVFGLFFTFWAVEYSFNSLLTVLTAIVTGTILIISFTLIIGSLSFFIGASRKMFDSGFHMILTFSFYPINTMEGFMRFLLFFVFPVGFITTVPVSLVKNFNIYTYLSLILVTVVVSLVAYGFFKMGLRRYESGSTMQIRL